MPIYTPLELVNSAPAATVEEAILKGVVNTVCTGAPYLAGYGALTGNIPALAFGLSGSIVCNLPLLPMPYPPPPIYIPVVGGQCATNYRVQVQGMWKREDGFTQVNLSPERILPGPIRGLSVRRVSTGSGQEGVIVESRYGAGSFVQSWLTVISTTPGAYVDWAWYNYVLLQREDGLPDNCGDSFPSQPVLPPGTDIPPGWPDAPYVPGGRDTQPYLPPPQDDGRRPWNLPIVVAPIILPVTVNANGTLSFPINAPIKIEAGLDLLPNAQISPTLNIQIDKDGNYRTEPDFLPEEEPIPDCPPPPVLTTYNVPFTVCEGGEANIVSQSIQVLPSSVPSGLFSSLLNSAELAVVGCESLPPAPVAASVLASGVAPSERAAKWSVELVDPEVSVVRLVIQSYRQGDIKETVQFAGTGQRLFGVISWSLLDGGGGADGCECWDRETDMRVPKSGKTRYVKVLVKAGVSWQLWDTGDRV